MVNFANMIGPAKPLTASEEAVASPVGVYLIFREKEKGIFTASAEGHTSTDIVVEGSCAVCLQKYFVGQNVRKLANCDHVFHRECVNKVSPKRSAAQDIFTHDSLQWLTESSNSCPLCRGLGIENASAEPAHTDESSQDIGRAI